MKLFLVLFFTLCGYLQCFSQKECAKINMINELIQEEQELDIEQLKFSSVDVIAKYPKSSIGSFHKDSLLFLSMIEDPYLQMIAKSVAEKSQLIVKKYKTKLGELNIDNDYLSKLDIRTIFLFSFSEDTILDIVLMPYDVAPSVYDFYFHVLIAPSTLKIIDVLPSAFDEVEPFGDFNNDGLLDFLTYDHVRNSNKLSILTFNGKKFKLAKNYNIFVKLSDYDFIPHLDKTRTLIQLFCGKEIITLGNRTTPKQNK
jgi:hypothetical protein